MLINKLIDAADGERIELAVKPHPFFALKSLVAGITLCSLGVASNLYSASLSVLLSSWAGAGGRNSHPVSPVSQPPQGLPWGIDVAIALGWGSILLIGAGVMIAGWGWLQRHFTEYAITSSPYSGAQIFKVSGVLRRNTVSVPVMVVNNLVVDEPLLGRIFGWGHLLLETGNDFEGDNLLFVPDPRAFHTRYQKLRRLGFGMGIGMGARVGIGGGYSPPYSQPGAGGGEGRW